MDVESAILEPFKLEFKDLILLSSAAAASSSSADELERLDSISAAVMQALGPSGPGLLSLTGVPRTSGLRRTLLPLARNLSLLENKERSRVLKEHDLGSDVSLKNLDRSVSSFSCQLKYAQGSPSQLFSSDMKDTVEEKCTRGEDPSIHRLQGIHDGDFQHLGETFKELGLCMMELGLRLAQVCDKAIGSRELEHSILDSLTAKGRLIHYHSVSDNLILKEVNKRTKGSKPKSEPVARYPSLSHASVDKSILFPGMSTIHEPTVVKHVHSANSSTEVRHDETLSNLWQQWHYDYGIFTVLTTPLFMSSCATTDCSSESGVQECSSPDGHTYLQLFNANENKIFVVKSPPDSFIIQVGEAADILSRGKLRSTLHSVGRPVGLETLSRETFVVFLQPAWNKILHYYGNQLDTDTRSRDQLTSIGKTSRLYDECGTNCSSVFSSQESYRLLQEILRKIPPLSSRFRDGMTFAEFSRETTKQYYGGNGTQSKR